MIIKKHITRTLNKLYPKRCFVGNIFNEDNEKSVLVSYITLPFRKKKNISYHSNILESHVIAKLFKNLGFNVDVIQFDCDLGQVSGLRDNYDLVFGIEPNFIKLSERYPKAKKIYYGTGANCYFQNSAEEKRIEQLKERREVKLARRRAVLEHKSSDLSDSVILIGNDWTKSTYKDHAKKVETIHVSSASAFPGEEIIKNKKWGSASKKFLWFGSVGAVHKGLDLLLEIFPKHKNLDLYICGAVEKEGDFVELYQKELKSPNIHLIGWIDPSSEKFKSIIEDCAFTILPSCSEGMSGSTATCMHAGLIPLVSKETGVDVGQAGVIFAQNNISEIEKVIVGMSKKGAKELKAMAQGSMELAKNNFTIKRFEKDFRSALKKVL